VRRLGCVERAEVAATQASHTFSLPPPASLRATPLPGKLDRVIFITMRRLAEPRGDAAPLSLATSASPAAPAAYKLLSALELRMDLGLTQRKRLRLYFPFCPLKIRVVSRTYAAAWSH
jgi:hypothetical protein